MRLNLSILIVAATLLVALAPAPAAADIVDPCEGKLLEPYCEMLDSCQPVASCCDIMSPNPCDCVRDDCLSFSPYVRNNGDGTYTVGYNNCGGDYWCDNDVATVSTDRCDYANVCDRYVPEPYVNNNGDGTYTIGYRTCDYYYGCEKDVATVSTDPCSYANVCDRYVPEVYANNNGDGTYTVGYRTCEYYCDNDVATVDSDPCAYAGCELVPDDLCYTYNDDALTNMCFTTGSGSQPVNHPTASVTSKRTCVIGEEGCVNHAWAQTGTGTTYVPTYSADGYFELTAACGFNAPCRVTLP
jgi:hypothetical protein